MREALIQTAESVSARKSTERLVKTINRTY